MYIYIGNWIIDYLKIKTAKLYLFPFFTGQHLSSLQVAPYN